MKMQAFLLAMEIAATSKSCSTDSTNMFCVSCMADDLPFQEPSCAFCPGTWSVLSLDVVRFVLERGPFCLGRFVHGPFCPSTHI